MPRCCAARSNACWNTMWSMLPTGPMPSWCRWIRAFRPERFHRLSDRVPGIYRSRRACNGGVPAIGSGVCRNCGHGQGRTSVPPGNFDDDGRADRHARKPHRGQRPRSQQTLCVVQAQCDRRSARGLSWRRTQGLSRLCPARVVHVDEPGQPHDEPLRAVQASGARRRRQR